MARLLTEDNTCSAIYDVAMVSHSLPSVPLRWSSPHRRSGCFAIVISGTVLTSLDLLLILDISRGATPIVVLCGNLSIDQLKFCVSCLRCYWYEPTLVCDSSQSIQRICGSSSPAQMHGRPKFLCTWVAELDGSKHPVTANNDDSCGLGGELKLPVCVE